MLTEYELIEVITKDDAAVKAACKNEKQFICKKFWNDISWVKWSFKVHRFEDMAHLRR